MIRCEVNMTAQSNKSGRASVLPYFTGGDRDLHSPPSRA